MNDNAAATLALIEELLSEANDVTRRDLPARCFEFETADDRTEVATAV